MTATKRRRSVIEEIEMDPGEAADIAAARALNHTRVILNKAKFASQLTQREIAEVLGIGESRVSQVLNGDGNIKVSTLARFLRAMGYTPEIEAQPIDRSLPSLSAKNKAATGRRRSKKVSSISDETYGTIAATRLVIAEVDSVLKTNRRAMKRGSSSTYRNGNAGEIVHLMEITGGSSWTAKKR